MYYISVYGYAYGSTRSSFVLSIKHKLSVTTLIPGIQVQDTLPEGYDGHYRIWSGPSGGELTISLSITYGSVSLYAKMNGEATEFDYDYSDYSDGGSYYISSSLQYGYEYSNDEGK